MPKKKPLPIPPRAGDGSPESDAPETTPDNRGAYIFQPIKLFRSNGHWHIKEDGTTEFKPEEGRRGPKSKKTQYDIAYGLRRDLWRRLVINPGLRVGVGYINREYTYIINLFLEFKERGINPRHWVRAAVYRLSKENKVVPDETELRKIKRSLMK